MRKDRGLTKQAFEKLLRWLDPDRDHAAEKYEAIRRSLVLLFASRGAIEPETLADETMDRVIDKVNRVSDFTDSYQGNPIAYFISVAHYVGREHMKGSRIAPLRVAEPESSYGLVQGGVEQDQQIECLEECLERLSPGVREMVMAYYSLESRERAMEHRKELARRMGLSLNALRLRMHRIRTELGRCITGCIERGHKH
jgi:DNA-directed RNA polymerase specialized sigma24 family protein